MELDFSRLALLRARRPLLHCISNLVSANDCANLALAAGASPIMAQAVEEVAEIAASAAAVVLNTGTPDAAKFQACRLAGTAANRAGRPVVLDPVGVGASTWRLEQITALLSAVSPTILRVNLGEAQALLRHASDETGVDTPRSAPQAERADCARRLAQQSAAVVLLSGAEDLVTDGKRLAVISGGSAYMTRVTGTGCMLSVLCGAFAAVEPDAFTAAVLSAAFWKRCGEQAACAAHGAGSFRTALLDAAAAMTEERLSAAQVAF